MKLQFITINADGNIKDVTEDVKHHTSLFVIAEQNYEFNEQYNVRDIYVDVDTNTCEITLDDKENY